jgi:hypothetical protein
MLCVDLIDDVFRSLSPERMIVTIVAKDFESVADLQEPVYGTRYSTKSFDASVIVVRLC